MTKTLVIRLIAAALVLLTVSQANAQRPGDRYHCYVSALQNLSTDGTQDHRFNEQHRRKRYEITVLARSILSVYTLDGTTTTTEYPIIYYGQTDLVGFSRDRIGSQTITIASWPDPKYGGQHTISVTVQGDFFSNAWLLLCNKT
jgi:hypothetical protein